MATSTRRQRREAELAARRGQRRGRGSGRPSGQPAWRSPMVLLTVAALLIGAGVIAFAVLSRPPGPTEDVRAPVARIPAELVDGRALGTADAPVTVEVWSDFQCPACKRFAEVVEPSLIRDAVEPGTARLEYRDMAFLGGGAYDESVESAAAARCAADQDRFWNMHAWIFENWAGENDNAFRAERLRQMAQGAGLDLEDYDACVASGDKQAEVRAETSAGAARGINSTPTLIINGEVYSGQLEAATILAAIRDAAGDGG